MATYYATKAFVLNLTEAIAEEIRGSGVTITALCPGPTATNFERRANIHETRMFQIRGVQRARDVAVTGWMGMQQGRRLIIVGWRNRLYAQVVRLLPRRLLVMIVKRLQTQVS